MSRYMVMLDKPLWAAIAIQEPSAGSYVGMNDSHRVRRVSGVNGDWLLLHANLPNNLWLRTPFGCAMSMTFVRLSNASALEVYLRRDIDTSGETLRENMWQFVAGSYYPPGAWIMDDVFEMEEIMAAI